MTYEMHRWILVTRDDDSGSSTSYMRVPGGRIYLYRRGSEDWSAAIVFVPDQTTTTINIPKPPIIEEVLNVLRASELNFPGKTIKEFIAASEAALRANKDTEPSL